MAFDLNEEGGGNRGLTGLVGESNKGLSDAGDTIARTQYNWHKMGRQHLDRIKIFDIFDSLVTRQVNESRWPTSPARSFLTLLRQAEMRTYYEQQQINGRLSPTSGTDSSTIGENAAAKSTPKPRQHAPGLAPLGSNGLHKLVLARVEPSWRIIRREYGEDREAEARHNSQPTAATAIAYKHILRRVSPKGLVDVFDLWASLEKDLSTTSAKLREPAGYKMTMAVAAMGARGALHGYMSGVAVDGFHDVGAKAGSHFLSSHTGIAPTPAASAWRLHDIFLEAAVHVGPDSSARRKKPISFEKAVNLFALRVMKDALAAAAARNTFLQHIHVSGTGGQVEWSLDDINDSKEMFFTAVKGAAVAKESLWLDLIHVIVPDRDLGQQATEECLVRVRRCYSFYYTDGNGLLRVFAPIKFSPLGCGIFFDVDEADFFAGLAKEDVSRLRDGTIDASLGAGKATALVLRGCCQGLASRIIEYDNAGRKLEALEELAIFIIAEEASGVLDASDESWETVLDDIAFLLNGHAAQVRELRSKTNLLAEFFDRFRVVMDEVGKATQTKSTSSASSSFDASLNDLNEVLSIVENVGWRWAKSAKRIMEEGAYSDTIALRYPLTQQLKALCDYANRRLKIPRMTGLSSVSGGADGGDTSSRQQIFQVYQKSARVVGDALVEQCAIMRNMAISMFGVLENSLTGITLSVSQEQEEGRGSTNDEVTSMQATSKAEGGTGRRGRAAKTKKSPDAPKVPRYYGPIHAINLIRMSLLASSAPQARLQRVNERSDGVVVTKETFSIDPSFELKKELTIRPRLIPGLLAAESVFLRYIVDSRLDQALEQVTMEVLLSSLSSNPYPQIAARMSTFAVKQALWRLTDQELLKQLDDCGRSVTQLVDAHLQVSSLRVPIDAPMDNVDGGGLPTDSAPSIATSAPQPAAPERTKQIAIYGDALILGKIAPGGARAVSNLLQHIPRLSDFSTAVLSDGMTCDVGVSLCSGTVLLGSGMLASPLPAIIEAQTDIIMTYVLQANANESSANFANYVVDASINVHDRTKHCLVGLYIGEHAYSWGAGNKGTRCYTINQLKNARDQENARKLIKARPFERAAIHILMEAPPALINTPAPGEEGSVGEMGGGDSFVNGIGSRGKSAKYYVPLILRLKFFVEGPPAPQNTNRSNFGVGAGLGAGQSNLNVQAFYQSGCEGMIYENIYGSFTEAKLLRRALMRSNIPRSEIQARFREALYKRTRDHADNGAFLEGYTMGARAALQSDDASVLVSFARMLRSQCQSCHFLEGIGRVLLLFLDLPTSTGGGVVNTGLLKINAMDVYDTIDLYVSKLSAILASPECVHFEAAISLLQEKHPEDMKRSLRRAADVRGRSSQDAFDASGGNLKILRDAQQLLFCLRLAISGDMYDISASSVEHWLALHKAASKR